VCCGAVCAVQVNQTLVLPVVAHKFMVPDPTIAKTAFFDVWKSMTGGSDGALGRACLCQREHIP
jgi:hypothetical protein